jgi:hypothetical protein
MMNMKKLIMGTLVLAPLILFGQRRDIERDFSAFDVVIASGNFNVTMNHDESYGVKLTVDDALQDYVQCYVRGNTLYLALSEKSIPKEVRKLYRGKNAPDPVLNAIVYLPALSALTLSDEATFTALDPIESDRFDVTLSGNAVARNLVVDAATVTIVCDKKSNLDLDVICDELDLKASGNAKVNLDFDTKKLIADNAGSASLILNGDADDVEIIAGNSSALTLGGAGFSLIVNGSGASSKVDASKFHVLAASIVASGTSVNVSADDELELDLSKGATVLYAGEPQVKIVRIENSSVLRH